MKKKKKEKKNFRIFEKITWQLPLVQLSHSVRSPLLHLQKINAQRLQLYRHVPPINSSPSGAWGPDLEPHKSALPISSQMQDQIRTLLTFPYNQYNCTIYSVYASGLLLHKEAEALIVERDK